MKPEIGNTYIINYVDRDYPCRCPCHRSNGMMKHIVACCHDMSYYGPAKCLGLSDAMAFVYDGMWKFQVGEYRILYIHESSIISEAHSVSG